MIVGMMEDELSVPPVNEWTSDWPRFDRNLTPRIYLKCDPSH